MDIKLTLTNDQVRALRSNKPINVTLSISTELRDDCREMTLVEFIEEFLPDEFAYKDLADKCGLNDSIFFKLYAHHRDGIKQHIPSTKTINKVMNGLDVRILPFAESDSPT